MNPLSRTHSPSLLRRLAPTLVGAGVFVLAACSATQAGTPAQVTAAAQATRTDSGQELRQPRLIESQNGLLNVTLEVVLRRFTVPQPQGDSTWTLRTYRVREANGKSWANGDSVGFPGPTFRVKPTDSVNIKLVNGLPKVGDDHTCLSIVHGTTQDTPPDCFHGFNYTNIHYHGFHVSPSPNADDVLLQIAPGDSFHYGFRIPQTQSPGTHWYHPHKHGSVAIQVVNGMAGGFVVVDSTRGLDSVQVANNITEKLLAFQQISDTVNLMVAGNPKSPATLVNGQYMPQITMFQGEVQRWRIVNENMTKTAAFSLTFIDSIGGQVPQLYEVARDGVQYAPANYDTINGDPVLLMAPGNRLDVLVRAPGTSGIYRAAITPIEHVGEEGDRSRKRRVTLQGAPGAAAAGATKTTTVLTVNVLATLTGGASSSRSTLPDSPPPLPRFLTNLPGSLNPATIPADSTEVVVFASSGTGPGTAPQFFLGTEQDTLLKFNPTSVYVPRQGLAAGGQYDTMRLNSLQTWKVVNHDSNINHPFHIHINPFQVVYVYAPNGTDSYKPLYDRLNAAAAGGNPIWLDVLPLPEASGSTQGYAIIRQRYDEFPGWYVMHCHILGHEERGMMQLLQVVAPGDHVRPPPDSVTNPGQTARGGAHHHH